MLGFSCIEKKFFSPNFLLSSLLMLSPSLASHSCTSCSLFSTSQSFTILFICSFFAIYVDPLRGSFNLSYDLFPGFHPELPILSSYGALRNFQIERTIIFYLYSITYLSIFNFLKQPVKTSVLLDLMAPLLSPIHFVCCETSLRS